MFYKHVSQCLFVLSEHSFVGSTFESQTVNDGYNTKLIQINEHNHDTSSMTEQSHLVPKNDYSQH